MILEADKGDHCLCGSMKLSTVKSTEMPKVFFFFWGGGKDPEEIFT